MAISVASTPHMLTPPHGFLPSSSSAYTPPHHTPHYHASALHKLRSLSPSRFVHHHSNEAGSSGGGSGSEDPIIAAAHVVYDLTTVQELFGKR